MLPLADGWAWQPFLGIETSHPHSGDLYVVPPKPVAPLHRVPACPAKEPSDALVAKVWYTFQPQRPLKGDLVLEELKAAADWLGCIDDLRQLGEENGW